MYRCAVNILLSAILGYVLPVALQAAQPAAEKWSAEQLEFFENKVRPVLARRCYECHAAEKQEGGLRVDSRAALLKGGDTGPAIELGQPKESLLIDAIEYGDIYQMPPQGKMPAEEIAALSIWVKDGAAWLEQPGGIAATATDSGEIKWPVATREHWSFQPVKHPPLPSVKNTAWPKSPLDFFILAELEARGLKPAAPLEKSALLRRVTFDLTGLPPTPAELDAFLADDSPDALAKVVERLLASPRYGEKWGRRWLDVARYSDSNGSTVNRAYGHAYRYRDYVIAAFNADKPYDQFVQEQIAGDLLPSTGNEQTDRDRLIATGFLLLGPKVLDELDPAKLEMDIVDEQVDTIGRAFMGLTLGCARCHDHKFDPISAADYYALAGILKSTRSSPP